MMRISNKFLLVMFILGSIVTCLGALLKLNATEYGPMIMALGMFLEFGSVVLFVGINFSKIKKILGGLAE